MALRAVERPGAFEPAGSTRRLATADDSAATALPKFAAGLMRAAPGVSLNIRPRPDHSLDLIEQGHADLLRDLTRRALVGGARAPLLG